MFTVDSHILRLADASLETAWRHQTQIDVAADPVAADEFLPGYRDELTDDEHTEIIRLNMLRGGLRDREPYPSASYVIDDVLRLAVPASQHAPLG